MISHGQGRATEVSDGATPTGIRVSVDGPRGLSLYSERACPLVTASSSLHMSLAKIDLEVGGDNRAVGDAHLRSGQVDHSPAPRSFQGGSSGTCAPQKPDASSDQ